MTHFWLKWRLRDTISVLNERWLVRAFGTGFVLKGFPPILIWAVGAVQLVIQITIDHRNKRVFGHLCLSNLKSSLTLACEIKLCRLLLVNSYSIYRIVNFITILKWGFIKVTIIPGINGVNSHQRCCWRVQYVNWGLRIVLRLCYHNT